MDLVGDEWMVHGACRHRGVPTDEFFPHSPDWLPRKVRETCEACPVRQECLDFALEHNEEAGVWGGVTERARAQILRRRRGGRR
jgi:WhiB family redox-sensing transcriptional regulator